MPKLEDILKLNWNQMNPLIIGLAEKDLVKLMELERAGEHRPYILLRIHQRYNKLRAERERKELCR